MGNGYVCLGWECLGSVYLFGAGLILMGYILGTFRIHLGYIRDTFGVHLGYIWGTFEVQTADVVSCQKRRCRP